MFQCPLVKTCFFFNNSKFGAKFFSKTEDGKDYNCIDCSECVVLNELEYQEIIERMKKDNKKEVDIFLYLNYYIKDKGEK